MSNEGGRAGGWRERAVRRPLPKALVLDMCAAAGRGGRAALLGTAHAEWAGPVGAATLVRLAGGPAAGGSEAAIWEALWVLAGKPIRPA